MANKLKMKKRSFARRKKSIKNKLTIGKYPRLVVYRSNIHLYAQLIDDNENKTMLSISTNDKGLKKEIEKLSTKIEKSGFIGDKIGKEIKKKKIEKVMFDRNGYIFHGRIKAFVEAVKKTGLSI
ncbi:MAG: 50S ribosomal protein L18 [Candidatus Marinimicrobia bacterium]|mgnify:CR=1 FL=1|nr:50S ribosomal protein L18 [Candidatus Neomarinimicrobiota bacterium]|tara:strand:+ start:2427 stop:2798 length:372 start_codon:yes stop_codon:yes gene_type:complete